MGGAWVPMGLYILTQALSWGRYDRPKYGCCSAHSCLVRGASARFPFLLGNGADENASRPGTLAGS